MADWRNRPGKPVVFLHIGAMKTGTTYLQSVLSAQREELREHGVLVPRGQVLAVRDALGLTGNIDGEPVAREVDAWATMSAEMLSWSGKASIVSMEYLSFARPWQARRVVETLAGADVHVVLTLRDAARVIPAQWQSYTRSMGTGSWPEYAVGVRQGAAGTNSSIIKSFRRAQNARRMLRAWESAVGPDRLHVVTVRGPGAPPDLLWERFASVVGVDPSLRPPKNEQTNPSLGYGSCDVLRRANDSLADVPRRPYNRIVRWLAGSVLETNRVHESRPRLDLATAEFAAELNRATIQLIRRGGFPVIGDLDELAAVPDLSAIDPGDAPQDPSEEEVLAAAALASHGLHEWLATKGVRTHLSWDRGAATLDDAISEVARLIRLAVERYGPVPTTTHR
jgi:hypothetical protein